MEKNETVDSGITFGELEPNLADPKSYNRKLIRSRPYIRKANMIIDKSLNFCWETCLRFNTFDLYVSILRRSYIPPFMDMYQDIIVCSKFGLNPDYDHEADKPLPEVEKSKKDNEQRSFAHLKATH